MGKSLIEHRSMFAQRSTLVMAEFLGTFMFVFLGCLGCVAGVSDGPIPHQQVSFTFGFALLLVIQCFGHLSGAHVNPSVTVASVVCGYVKPILVPFYLIGQFLGALAGYAAVMSVTPYEYLNSNVLDPNGNKIPGVCSPNINSRISTMQGLAVEFIATAFLAWFCCSIWDRKNTNKHDSLSIRFGCVVVVLALACGPYTGTNLNPARSLAPALLNGDWNAHWVYWVGPLSGAFVSSAIYKVMYQTSPPIDDGLEGVPLK